ncbi:hypothetical protein ASD77_15835 [Pseudoxanthomonas sp. Root65]|uniref:hypothetical protein n=1 Tax=Pseudoxanthomonas sp. Root65 TaxID=1736576 RepID=UPI0006FE39EE|nr:hypothetical protein [Pseudoxanthomonas sp. Root65]KRA51384.1 hypothetical protein ASD77_15835 [Pseudoxanthomonas sp. Root65]
MPNILRNIAAVAIGLVLGSVVNMAIVMLGPALVSPPPGVDMTTAEGLQQAMPLLQPKHFIAPFLAHALGTLVGALLAYGIAGSRKTLFAWVIGVLFLCGGIATSLMIPAPTWFKAIDLLLAYLPMAWLAAWIGARMRRSRIN